MAKGFENLHVKSAIKTHNKFDLSQTHLTTMDFGEIVPLFAEEVIPGDKFNVKGNYFSRLAPLAKPTYGKFQFKTMAAFVPYFQVADDVEGWLDGKLAWEGTATAFRKITMMDLVNYFKSIAISVCHPYLGEKEILGIPSGYSYSSYDEAAKTVTWTASTQPDIVIKYDWAVLGTYSDAPAEPNFFVFRGAAKYKVKVLNALGYALPQGVDLRTTSSWYINMQAVSLNAMPLLCFAKAYNDYMSQSQRYNISTLSSFLRNVKENKGTTGYNNGSSRLLYDGIATIMDNIILQYENDYFTSAWQTANDAIGSTGTSSKINTASVAQSAGATAAAASVQSNGYSVYTPITSNNLSQRSLDLLRNFDDWVRRNNYSGSRAVQNIYSRFGIKTEDYRANYAHVVDTDVIPVQVGDVTAQADTTGAALGDYAGKGIMSGEHGFSFESNDYGMLFILGWYTVTPMYAYGFSRTTLKNSPLDFYNPEFDGMGANPISVGEVFENPIATLVTSGSVSADTTLDTAVFGFTERYNEYRFGRDKITGEFRNYHSDSDMNVWHTGRLLGDVRAAGNLVAQSSNVNAMPQSNSEYNRIFSITDDSVNHFYVTAQFNVDAVRPMLSLNQVPRLGEGDTKLPRNGNVIN